MISDKVRIWFLSYLSLSYNHESCSIKKVSLKILWYLLENTCVGVSFNEARDMQAVNFVKKRLQLRCEYWAILRTLILKNTCERLLLYFVSYFGKNNENKDIYVYIRNAVRNHIPWWKMIWWWQSWNLRNIFSIKTDFSS